MGMISEAGEEQEEDILISIFSFKKKKIRAKEKRSCCGPGWLDRGVHGRDAAGDGGEEQPIPVGGGPPKSCKVLPGSRDHPHAEQFT